VGVNLKQFTRELDGQVFRDRVRADYLSGVRAGVKGTPTIFINGEKYSGAYEFDALVAAFLKASRGI
jgi:protein-disulfide isomerase